MKHLPLCLETTVLDALLASGRTSGVFRAHKTVCVGCYLARFCTLRDVARTYDLSPDAFLAELEQAAVADSSLFTGAHHENSF